MSRIKALDKSVYEKIAAGEIIDRPSAVVRELLDNSFDAEAGKIKIIYKESGLEEISVSDNGNGIHYDDLEIAPRKHCTSKINEFDDIFKIYSMGFRGEALSSIASISHLRITSFNGEDEHGGELYTEGGDEFEIKPYVRSKGTTVEVKKLFYNVPVRQKFSKSLSVESRSINSTVQNKVIPYHDISINLINNDKTVFNLEKQNLLDRILFFHGNSLDKNDLIYFSNPRAEQGMKVYGYISAPHKYYHNRMYQYFYVNKRPVVINSLYYVISSVLEGLLPSGKFPYIFLFVEIDPQNIDVNIHPAKKEIKFINERYIVSLIKKSILDAFKNGFPVPDFNVKNEEILNNQDKMQDEYLNKENFSDFLKFSVDKRKFENEIVKDKSEQSNILDEYTGEYKNDCFITNYKDDIKTIGILFDTYLLVEKQDEFYILDYHAAHERINYEKLKEQANRYEESIPSQKLLSPFNVDFTSEEAEILLENLNLLNELGYEISDFGDNSFIINAVPSFKTFGSDEEVLLKLVNLILKGDKYRESNVLMNELLKIEACRMSVKSGDNPSPEQISNLIYKFLKGDYPKTCPHGRPVIFKMSKEELDKKFLRL